MRASGARVDLRDQIDVRQGAATESDKARRIEALFEVLQSVRDRVALFLDGGEVQEFTVSNDRRNLLHWNDDNVFPPPHGNPLEKRRLGERLVGIDSGT